ncbi:long-chain-fatty-acid--CoA ligase [Gloeobacter morelensis]|uniref:Long-chain fatty acid--CoA ligase n=1 Tax=Gloeobacter morelensis MG652769 TaxID=2781736 RepID=A0ABY3PMM8_9CYAN|nr:long-chain fatty acid--CoA ligase [Gloeobacter morelensis]UFP94940.1 long-chain fatty acid--CoA ligase [Gloeobacter morelensis MG652769]
MNLAHLLDDQLRHRPEKVAFEGDGRSLSYAQLARLSENFAASLTAAGYGPGDRIAVVLPNVPEYALAMFALWRLGAVPVLINPQLTGRELDFILRDSQARAVILPEALLGVLAPLRSELPNLQAIVLGVPADQDLNFAGLAATPGQCPVAERHGDDIAQIMYTSGTTGTPKGALISHGNLLANARSGVERLSVTSDDHLFCILPVFHAFAFTAALVIMPLAGGSVSFEYRLSPKKLTEHLSDPRVSVMVAVPSLLSTILRFPSELKLSAALRCILCGGGPLTPQLEAAFAQRFGDRVRQGYGMTECSPYAAFSPPDRPSKPGSIGLPMPQGHKLAVRDPISGNFAAPGEVGELVVSGPHVFKGYWNQPEATAQAFVDGWLRSGDLGYCDEEGYFFLVDRLKDMIIVGGEKVYSREVEDVLLAFAPLREVAVVGQPDPDKGEVVRAFVSLQEGATIGEEEIVRFARERLASVKVPKSVTILAELPKSATGKILKRELRKQFAPK